MAMKIAAMKRIAEETDKFGFCLFPRFMLENAKGWEKEGLVSVVQRTDGLSVKITAKGRCLAKKAMS
jgi:hypothetical protein